MTTEFFAIIPRTLCEVAFEICGNCRLRFSLVALGFKNLLL